MKNNKDELYGTLVPSLKDRFFQQQLNFEEETKETEAKPIKKYSKFFLYSISLVIAFSAFSYLAYTSYKYSAKPESIEDIPLVKKEITPIRAVPADPGGEKFSNQDKLIYNNLLDSSVEKNEQIESAKVEPEVLEVKQPEKELTAPLVKPKAEKEPEQKEPILSPKKEEKKIKTKVAKKAKKIDNPFDILDGEMSSLDSYNDKN